MPAEGDLRARAARWVPRWWRGEAGFAGRLLDAALWPAELLFAGATAARGLAYDAGVVRRARAPIPVVSVGNLAVGGAGKTPVAAWVAATLHGWGERPAVLMRGYGSDELGVHRELNPEVPVFAEVRRVRAARGAAAAGCTVAVLDDGFQHRALHRELDLVLVAADAWTDRRRLLPRGPWREPVAALRRADLVVVTRKSAAAGLAAAVADELARVVPPERVARCHIAPTRLAPLHPGSRTPRPLAWLQGARVVGVSSLAVPHPFLAHLRGAGAEVESAEFADHYEFTAADARTLVERSGGRPIVMTRKEAVKLRRLLDPEVDGWIVEQEVRFDAGEDTVIAALHGAVAR